MLKGVKNKSRLLMGLAKSRSDLSTVKFVHFYGPSFSNCKSYDLSDYASLLSTEVFHASKKTVLYLHGYLENLEVESISVIVEAYLQRDDVNLIVLDWGELADGNYAFDAVVNIKQLGPVLAKILLEMFECGLDISRLHIVGHSLGAQMAGIIGREVYRRSAKSMQIKRITGLDPAFPLFYFTGCAHLGSKDAQVVDIIHTDAWLYGAPVSTGTVDFWPNSGKTLQPGCPKRNYKMLTDNDLSSHRRSWRFWAESVYNRDRSAKFEAVKAKSWDDFKNAKFLDSDDCCVFMGHDCPTNITGNYFLQTNGCKPYARGKAGTVYVDPKELVANFSIDT